MEATIFRRDFLNILTPQLVPDSPQGLDGGLRPHKGQFFAGEGEIDLHVVVLGVTVKAPDFFRKLFPGENPFLVDDEIFQDPILLFAQADTLGRGRTDEGGGIGIVDSRCKKDGAGAS